MIRRRRRGRRIGPSQNVLNRTESSRSTGESDERAVVTDDAGNIDDITLSGRSVGLRVDQRDGQRRSVVSQKSLENMSAVQIQIRREQVDRAVIEWLDSVEEQSGRTGSLAGVVVDVELDADALSQTSECQVAPRIADDGGADSLDREGESISDVITGRDLKRELAVEGGHIDPVGGKRAGTFPQIEIGQLQPRAAHDARPVQRQTR